MPPKVVRTFSCSLCKDPDNNHMVQCDRCQSWYHYQCVGVGDSVADRSWLCPSCDKHSTTVAPETLRKNESKSQRSKASTSTSVKAAKAALDLQQLQEQKQLELQRIQEETIQAEKEVALAKSRLESEKKQREKEAALEKKRLEDERKRQEAEEEFERLQLKKETIRQEALRKLEEKFLAEKYRILNAQLDEDGSSKSGCSEFSGRRTKQWVEDLLKNHEVICHDERPNEAGPNRIRDPLEEPKQPLNSTEIVNPNGNARNLEIREHADRIREFPIESPIRSDHNQPPVPKVDGRLGTQDHVQRECEFPNQQNISSGCNTLTSGQLAARSVFSKELPTFTGNPEEWPLFYSSYLTGTKECGLTNAENLIRLQRCLKGEALEAVRSCLLIPETVPCAMETLEMCYGRPDVLVNTLLVKIRNTPAPKEGRLETLIAYGLAIKNFCNHILAAKLEDHFNNPTLLQELVEKLPMETKMKWADYMELTGERSLGCFGRFMHEVLRKAITVTPYNPHTVNKPVRGEEPRPKGGVKYKGYLNHHSEAQAPGEGKDDQPHIKKACIACEKPGHRLENCGKFENYSIDERRKIVRLHNLCWSCLKSHVPWPCRRPKDCSYEGCRYRHHPLLHSPPSEGRPNPSPNNFHRTDSTAIYRIVPVTIHNGSQSIPTFALLDEASEVTMIEQDLADNLNLKGTLEPLHLQWTANVTRFEENSRSIDLQISGKDKRKRYCLKNARTVEVLELPIQSICHQELIEEYPHLRGLPLTDYEFARPQLLIGLENIHLATPLKICEGAHGQPIATKTRLGWCIYGAIPCLKTRKSYQQLFHGNEQTEDEKLNEIIKQHIVIDNLGVRSTGIALESNEDKRAREILESTTRRIPGGFETGILWKSDNVVFPDGFSMALSRLNSLEKKIYKNPELANRVKQHINEYLEKGYAHKATYEELNSADPKRVWYLPLGVVISPKKPEKLRLIWDASSKVRNTSFNSLVLKGPDLLTSLPAILFRFRSRRVAICGDLKEMFHQIKIRSEDLSAQRFLWRDDPSAKPEVYTMDVATFGSACSPCSAHYIKNLNARDYEDKYPEAAEAIINGHYVDDYLDSKDTEEQIISLTNDIRFVHRQGGFEIRNFRSNSSYVLKAIGEIPLPPKELGIFPKEIESVLGIQWLPVNDVFTFSLNLPNFDRKLIDGSIRPTKRQILRIIMTIYDPLGLLAAFIIQGKIIIQKLWKTGCNWDDEVNDEIFSNWKRWTNLFSGLGNIHIPRSYFGAAVPELCKPIQLHVLVDASEEAYACVAYFRYTDGGVIRCSLVGGKSKVAPVKTLSIPRLELQSAVLGTRLADFIQKNHQIPITERFFWTDSATVLHWIHSDTRKYHSYVACRIGEILTSTNIMEWKWVPSRSNVADEATKWGRGPCFEAESRWLRGPDFLWGSEDSWPEQKWNPANGNEELRSSYFHAKKADEKLIDVHRFHKWERMHRTIAYAFRFGTPRSRSETSNEPKSLELLDQKYLRQAEMVLLQIIQQESFPEEMVALRRVQNGKPAGVVPITSPLYKLSAYIDEEGLVRMDGRIGAAPNLPIEAKCPIILAKNHPITFLLVDYYHRRYLHRNAETVFNEIRQLFYITGLRKLIRTVGSRCQWCKVYGSSPMQPMMAPLPKARLVAFQRPFTYVGLDYFGPILVRVGRSHVKRWVALFTCFTTRAIHLEVAHSLSAVSCKFCIRRFIARRGAPAEIYTDNGTNFRGAANELQRQLNNINQRCAETFTNTNTKWYFNPPAAPHTGGVWERLVRSVKTALEAFHDIPRVPDDETFETIILEAESMINSRPLTYIPLNDATDEALTPNHFLLGSSTGVKQPPKDSTSALECLRSSWNLAQHILDGFWRRWLREYLPTIARRTKWFNNTKPIEVGDLVFVADGKQRNSWVRGKIIEVTLGRDKVARQAVVQTNAGKMRRAVGNLAVIDVVDECKDEIAEGTTSSYGGEIVEANCTSVDPPIRATAQLKTKLATMPNQAELVRVHKEDLSPNGNQNSEEVPNVVETA
ncbi:uncharacterized protein LOC129742523 [Uranotaenia lowii]|uniref:uncharacterized protein LOC129742523 n=1 Tax=Uranotaenia lowii TaxID=190385 RepID=UPI0024789611|nr:uncharacterized protein LOC129742523 [Uranotaenia lowii]